MATKKGCFTILGEISWIILWISFTFALFIDYSSSEEVFNLKENISVLLIWLVPLFIYLLFYHIFQHHNVIFVYNSINTVSVYGF